MNYFQLCSSFLTKAFKFWFVNEVAWSFHQIQERRRRFNSFFSLLYLCCLGAQYPSPPSTIFMLIHIYIYIYKYVCLFTKIAHIHIYKYVCLFTKIAKYVHISFKKGLKYKTKPTLKLWNSRFWPAFLGPCIGFKKPGPTWLSSLSWQCSAQGAYSGGAKWLPERGGEVEPKALPLQF